MLLFIAENIRFNSIYRNCNTEALKCLKKALPQRFNSHFKVYWNAGIDYFLHSKGLIYSPGTHPSQLRKKHDITSQVKSYRTGDFSKWIRKNLP